MGKALKWYFVLAVVVSALIDVAVAKKQEISIGGLFHGDDGLDQIAFKYAIERINSQSRHYHFVSSIFNISRTDSVKAQQIVCKLADEGVSAIFGPSSIQTSGVVASIAETFEIPHIIYHWKMRTLHWEKSLEHGMTLNLYPDSEILAEAFANVLVDYSWKSYTIIYESKENLIRLKDVLQIHDPNSIAIHIKQLPEGEYGLMLKEINARGDFNIILDISTEKIIPFLKVAAEVNMVGDYNNYFITNLDTHTLDLSEIPELTSNITCLRLVDPHSEELNSALSLWQHEDLYLEASQVPHQTGLIHDALLLYLESLKAYGAGNQKIPKNKHNCNEPARAVKNHFGLELMSLMKSQKLNGVTGPVEFNDNELMHGGRTQFTLQILELSRNGYFSKIGYWDTTDRVKYDREDEDELKVFEIFQNKTLKIVVKLGEPFLRRREPEEGITFEGNEQYEGYVVDLVNKMQSSLHFDYVLEVVPDGQYGSLNPETKKWNGLVKHLLERKADLAIADLTINYERKTAVDFTSPFINLGIGILYIKPPPKVGNLFSFLDPFTSGVWLNIGLAYLSVSVFALILTRINDDDWEPADPRQQNPHEVESIWKFLNCVWLAMSIMGQGCDILPKGWSTRILTSLWWFFALLMLASYTANLAAFLTEGRSSSSIKGAEDLAKQSRIKFGSLIGGSTMRFFQESNFSTYQRMWATMESAGAIVHAKSNDEGVARVKKENGKYAFLMESVVMEYRTNRDCSIMQVGELLDSKGYGIALPINSPYRKAFSEQILKLSESGALNKLKDDWWKTDEISCVDDKSEDHLGIADVGGVFLLLTAGCLVAFVVGALEFLSNVEKIAIAEKVAPVEVFKSELSFALKFWIAAKPVRLHQSGSSKSSSPGYFYSDSPCESGSRSSKSECYGRHSRIKE